MEVLATRLSHRKKALVRAAAAAALLVVVAACGGDSGTGPEEEQIGPEGPNGPWLANGSMSARINGEEWRASMLVQAIVTPGSNTASELLMLTGIDSVGRGVQNRRALVIALDVYPTLAPGSYGLGMNVGGGAPGTIVSLASIVDANGSATWITPLPDLGSASNSGTITITSLTATRVAGTFSYNTVADPGNSTANQGPVAVTQGVFDVEVTRP